MSNRWLLKSCRLKLDARTPHFRAASSSNDSYEVLGLNRTAKQSEIKEAYYRLSKLYHPDVNKTDAAALKFQSLAEAYETLGTSESRKTYDRIKYGQLIRSGKRNSRVEDGQSTEQEEAATSSEIPKDNEDYTQFWQQRVGGYTMRSKTTSSGTSNSKEQPITRKTGESQSESEFYTTDQAMYDYYVDDPRQASRFHEVRDEQQRNSFGLTCGMLIMVIIWGITQFISYKTSQGGLYTSKGDLLRQTDQQNWLMAKEKLKEKPDNGALDVPPTSFV